MPTEVEIAWAAGLFEGEGCIHFTDKRAVSVSLTSTDHDVIRRFNAVFQGRIEIMKPREPHHKTPHRWALGKATKVRALLVAILPYLGERRGAKAREALDRIAARLEYCSNGHKRTKENTYWYKGKARYCRDCRKIYTHNYEKTRTARPKRTRIINGKIYPVAARKC